VSDEPLNPDLLKAAEAISDARPVEWEGAAPGDDATRDKLKVLETIAGVHRAGGSGDAAGAAAGEAGAGADEGTTTAGAAGHVADDLARAAGDDATAGVDVPVAAFLWGPLRVIDRLGEGSFGEVWRAWDPSLRREVALKLRRDDAGAPRVRRWLEEAPRLARVRHPHVVTVYGAAVHDERAGLWMEMVRGVTLEQWLASHGRLGAREAALIGVDLCGALAAVHAAGVAHGDVTASNVMREGTAAAGRDESAGRLVLMDFGSGYEIGSAGDVRFVTPLAAAPEVLGGDPPTPRADLYSLGVLLYRLVTGRYPVEAESVPQLIQLHRESARPSLRTLRPDLPASFVAAVERALEPDSAARFADAGAMERALAATLSGAAAQAPAPPKTNAFRLGLIGALAAALAAVLVPRLFHDRPGSPASTAQAPTSSAPAAPLAGGETGNGAAATPATGTNAATGAAAASLAARADFYRVAGDAPERLSENAAVAPGERLFLALDTPEPVYAYVLNEDDQGRTYVLFPVAGLDRANPLPAGHDKLPGTRAGRDQDWRVTSEGGREHFLAIVSRHPLPAVERELAAIASVARDRPVTHAPSADSGLRGVGGLADEPAGADARAGRLSALAGRLRRDASPDVWWKAIVLRNPSP
jgi:hypothetical protein